MPKLFDDDDAESDVEIKTNTEYASHYNSWREKEEFNKLKTKYGDIAIENYSEDDESSSSEDDDGEALTEEFEKNFFTTLACLKKKDPRIYDKNTKFFKNEEQNKETENKQDKCKEKKKDPLLLKNYEKKILFKTGGKFEDDEDDSENEVEESRSQSPTYVEEQRRLKESFKKALNDGDDEDNNWGGLFQKRSKTMDEHQKEEDEYTQWLKGQKKELENKEAENELKPLKSYWNNPELDKDEAFLRDYLLNKRYLEKENENYIPTYEEIIHDSDEGLSEDEKNIDNQEEFETKYNHRYEEPDTEYIKRYPRTMANSVRKTDDRRKLKRVEIKQRKEEEKKQKQEELKQLKALKRKEIEEKIKKLKEITGNDDLSFKDNDLEEDFDPDAYDRRMQEIFNDEYYSGIEGEQKPEYPDLDEELGPWAKDNELHCEDDNFIMDCDYDPNAPNTSKQQSKKKRNRYDKKGNKIENSEFDENDERYKEYTDELYQMDYEDMIGDLPCRFKYREVVPNSFGLSIEEILLAKDRELNRWCSLKKATQHRPEHVEKYDVIAFQQKATNENLKKKILTSLYEELEELKEDENIQMSKKEFTFDQEKLNQNKYLGKDDDLNENTVRDTKMKGKQRNNNLSLNTESAEENANNSFSDINKVDKDMKKVNTKESKINVSNSELTKNSLENVLSQSKTNKRRKRGFSEISETKMQKLIQNECVNKDDVTENTVPDTKKKGKKRKNNVSLNTESDHNNEIDKDIENINTEESKQKKRKKDNAIASENKKKNSIENVLSSLKTEKKRKRKFSDISETKTQNVIKIADEIKTVSLDQIESKCEGKLSKRQKKNRKKVLGKHIKNVKSEVNKKSMGKHRKSTVSGRTSIKKFKHNKNKYNQKTNDGGFKISDSRLEAYGINPKKYKNKLKFKK